MAGDNGARPVAIIIVGSGGGSSSEEGGGVGVALAKYLLCKGWRVAVADDGPMSASLGRSSYDSSQLFCREGWDVREYTRQARFFADAWECFGGERLDLLVVIATAADDMGGLAGEETGGVGADGDGLVSLRALGTPFERTRLDIANGCRFPERLELGGSSGGRGLDGGLEAVVQGIWLFRHFVEQNVGDDQGGMVIVVSSSSSGPPSFGSPAKKALLGIVRSAAPVLAKGGVAINAVVSTSVAPQAEMVARAFDVLIYGEGSDHFGEAKFVNDASGRKVGKGEQGRKLTGQVLDVGVDGMFFRASIPGHRQWLTSKI